MVVIYVWGTKKKQVQAKQLSRGRKTFGKSKNLRKLIKENITKEMYKTILKNHKEVVVTISNLTTNKIEYKSINETSYEDFCD